MNFSITQLALGYLSGALTTLSPCVLPILPFVVGGAIQENKLAPLAISAGLLISFVAIGWPVAAFGSLLGIEDSTIRFISGIALGMAGLILLIPRLQDFVTQVLTPLASRAQSTLQKSSSGNSTGRATGLKGHFITGLFLGAIWSPCSGPTMGAAIALAAQEGSGLASGLIMVFFGLGAISPLLAVSYGAKTMIHKSKAKIFSGVKVSKKVFGTLMIFIGVSIVNGLDKKLETYLLDKMPEAWVNLVTRF